MLRHLPYLLAILMSLSLAQAEDWMPSIFSDHMVLQRDLENPVWGTAVAGTPVAVTIAGQLHQTEADTEGRWRVRLDPLPAGGPHELIVQAGEQWIFSDVLVGEVWFCSGQSNMEWTVRRSAEAALETVSANHPQIRFLKVPNKSSEEPQVDFEGAWVVCSPESVANFSAVGYLFGRRLHDTLGVPIGMVDLSWGGSAAEAWVPREVLARHDVYKTHLAEEDARLGGYTDATFAKETAEWKKALSAWKVGGRESHRPRRPADPRYDNRRSGGIFNGVVHPVLGYGLRGNLWYQGESNASRDPQTYGHLFPLVVETLRERWGQGDFPFYWVQLTAYREQNPEPEDSEWARLREFQTMALDVVPNGGQAVIIDAGEGRDIHPRDKHTVANRLARIALACDYGFEIPYQSPRYDRMEIQGDRATIHFKHTDGGSFRPFGVRAPIGFAIAGEDRIFKWARARVTGPGQNQVEVWHHEVPHPVAVRYGWANNPVLNLFDEEGLPVTPFRTDDW